MPQGGDDQMFEISVVVSEYNKLDSFCGYQNKHGFIGKDQSMLKLLKHGHLLLG